jgi:hypothetical protein
MELFGTTGQERRQWLDQRADGFANMLSYYLGPTGIPERMGAGANLLAYTDAGDMVEAADASRSLWNDPSLANAARYTAAGAAMALPFIGARGVNELSNNAIDWMADESGAIRAWHGSPHDFDRFSMDKIGGGEGVQAEGYGLYFAENPQVAQRYRDRVRDAEGRLYEVSIDANPEDFVDWNSPLSGQPQGVRDWFDSRGISEGFAGNQSGMELLMAERAALGDKGVAESMREAGIPGIRYLDAGSRGAGDGSRNYVVFDDELITILKKYGIAGVMAGGAVGGMSQEEQY